MRRASLALVALFASLGAARAVPLVEPSDVEIVGNWIADLQFDDASLPSFGAILRRPATEGVWLHRVEPHEANLAVIGMLQSSLPGRLGVAERWIDWYLDHLNAQSDPPGIVYDHWYRADGTAETAAPPSCDNTNPSKPNCHYDSASNRYAATLIEVVWRYYESGGDREFLTAPGVREKLETVAGVMLELQQEDGLTWSKPNQPVKLLMHNSEVFAGFECMAYLEERVYDDAGAAQMYRQRAAQVRNAINNDLFDGNTQTYRIAKFADGTYREADPEQIWFPDAVVQTLPHLYGVVHPDSPRAQAAVSVLGDGTALAGENAPDGDSGGSSIPMETAVGYAAMVAGDFERAKAAAVAVKGLHAEANWPLTVADAGWLLRTLTPRAEKQSATTDEDTSVDIPLRGRHVEGDASSFAIVVEPSRGTITIDGSVATYTPERDSNQLDRFEYAVTYGQISSAAAEVTIHVDPVNDLPVLGELTDRVLSEDAARQTVLLEFGSGGGDDEREQVVTLTATTDNPKLIHDLQVVGNELTFTPLPDVSGQATVTVSASDRVDAVDVVTQSFSVVLEGVNDPPSLAVISDVSIVEDDGGQSIELSATAGGGEDEALQSLTFTVESSNTGLIPTPTISGTTLNFAPVADSSGTATVTVAVDDGEDRDNITTRTFKIDVSSANDPPALTRIADQVLAEGDSLSIALSATDVDGDALTYSADNLPAGARLSGSVLSWPPGYDAAGTYYLVLKADDGIGGVSSQTLTITVNDAPAPGVASSLALWDFGDVDEGIASERVFYLHNPGRLDVTIDELSVGGGYEIVDASLPITVAAGDSVGINLRFAPAGRRSGAMGDTLTVSSSAGDILVPVSGRGMWSDVTMSADSLEFGRVRVGATATLKLLVSNPGNQAMQLDSAQVDNQVFGTDSQAKLLKAGAEDDEIVIAFTPVEIGTQSGTVTIAGSELSMLVAVRGEGVAPVLELSLTALDFGEVLSDSNLMRSVSIRNTGSDTLNILSMSELAAPFTLDSLATATVAPLDSVVVTVSFAGIDGIEEGASFADSLWISTDAGDAEVALVGAIALIEASDFNRDGGVDLTDYFMLADVFYQPATTELAIYDQDGSGRIDFQDLFIFADDFDQTQVEGSAERRPAAAADRIPTSE